MKFIRLAFFCLCFATAFANSLFGGRFLAEKKEITIEEKLKEYVEAWSLKIQKIKANSVGFFEFRKRDIRIEIQRFNDERAAAEEEFKFAKLQTKRAEVASASTKQAFELATEKGWVEANELKITADEAEKTAKAEQKRLEEKQDVLVKIDESLAVEKGKLAILNEDLNPVKTSVQVVWTDTKMNFNIEVGDIVKNGLEEELSYEQITAQIESHTKQLLENWQE